MKNLLLSLCLLGVAGHAAASFELLLVLDRGTGGPGTSTVKRFDPETGVYLGQFGGFSASVDSIVVDQSRTTAYVRDNSTVFRYNYNTGAFLGSFSVSNNYGQMALRPDGALFVPDNFNDILAYNPVTGSLLGGFYPVTYGNHLWRSIAFNAATGQTYGFSPSFNNGVRLNTATGAFLGATVNDAIPGVSTDVVGQISTVGGRAASMVFGTGTGSVVLTTDGGLGPSSLVTFAAGFGLTSTRAVAPAHFGFYVAGTGSSGALIAQYNENAGAMRSFTGGGLTNPVSMASVLAPEPGTLAALSLGVIAALRRRKRG